MRRGVEEGKPGGMHIIRSKGEYSESFGLRYLVTFAKAAQLCSNLTVSSYTGFTMTVRGSSFTWACLCSIPLFLCFQCHS